MWAAQVVELSFGDREGSGYLLTSRHVLTAKHVIDPSEQGALGEVRALATPESEDLVEIPPPKYDLKIRQPNGTSGIALTT